MYSELRMPRLAVTNLLIRYVCSMLWSNVKRERKYGSPDLDKSKEAGMQDKMEWENKVGKRQLSLIPRNINLNGYDSFYRISATFFELEEEGIKR
jgi:hypothetical protein